MLIQYEVNGRRVPPERFGEEFADAVMKAAIEGLVQQVQATLEGVRCPEHGQPLSEVTIQVEPDGNISIRAQGCCDAAIQAAYAALGTSQS